MLGVRRNDICLGSCSMSVLRPADRFPYIGGNFCRDTLSIKIEWLLYSDVRKVFVPFFSSVY